MARIRIHVLLMIISFANVLTGFAIQIEIAPEKVNEMIHNEVHITCTPDASPSLVKEVIVIEVGKEGENPLAIIRQHSNITYDTGIQNNLQAEGHLEHNRTQHNNTYLRLSITNPSLSDSGTYTCQMFYLDQTGLLQEERVSANLTVDNQDVKSVLKYLVDKVYLLEETVSKQKDIINQQEMELKEQSIQVSAVNTTVRGLQDLTMNQTQVICDMAEKGKAMSAFSAGYDYHDTWQEGDVLVFRDVFAQIGGGYNSSTGIFTAPRAGVYVFHLVVNTNIPGYLRVNIVANNKPVAAAFCLEQTNYYEQSSASTVVQLQAGQEVMNVISGATASMKILYSYSPLYSVFTGYLVKAIE